MEALSAASPLALTGALPGKGGRKLKFTWEHGAMLLLGGAAIISSGMLLVQWKHATMGRRVSKDVVTFLQKHGAQINGKKISGGPVTIPMNVDEAVVGTIDTIISDINNRTSKKAPGPVGPAGARQPGPPGSHARTPDVVAAAMGQAGIVPGGPVVRSGRSPAQGRGPADQLMMPVGSTEGAGNSASGHMPQAGNGKGAFPEPPLSGRTGLPVGRADEPMMRLPDAIGGMSHDSQGEAGNGDDFSYQPPMPPGMQNPGASM